MTQRQARGTDDEIITREGPSPGSRPERCAEGDGTTEDLAGRTHADGSPIPSINLVTSKRPDEPRTEHVGALVHGVLALGHLQVAGHLCEARQVVAVHRGQKERRGREWRHSNQVGLRYPS